MHSHCGLFNAVIMSFPCLSVSSAILQNLRCLPGRWGWVRNWVKSMCDASCFFFFFFHFYAWNILFNSMHVCVISLTAAQAMAGSLKILILFRRKLSKRTGSRAKGSLWARRTKTSESFWNSSLEGLAHCKCWTWGWNMTQSTDLSKNQGNGK